MLSDSAPTKSWNVFRTLLASAAIALLAGCTIAKPRTDDPWEKWNRKAFAFNQAADKAVIRPVAMGYRHVTTPNMRRVISNFYTNVRTPITMVNNLLQGQPKAFMRNTSRFLVNTTIGLAGLFDPASQMGFPLDQEDFGVTLAKWGVRDGPYLVLPFLGPTTGRDVFRYPVDTQFEPLTWYANRNDFRYNAQNWPSYLFLVTLRSRGIDAEGLLEGVYDPYVFYRDAYRQQRIYQIYDGNPPVEVIEQLQGVSADFDPEDLLDEQRKYEQAHADPTKDTPKAEPEKH
jgi:phospholipid-binding lipoprotein MlaA